MRQQFKYEDYDEQNILTLSSVDSIIHLCTDSKGISFRIWCFFDRAS